jgi:hypothetical protein
MPVGEAEGAVRAAASGLGFRIALGSRIGLGSRSALIAPESRDPASPEPAGSEPRSTPATPPAPQLPIRSQPAADLELSSATSSNYAEYTPLL